MQLHEVTLLTLVSLLEFLQSAANSKHGYTDFSSQNFRRNDQRRGNIILYRPIRNNHHYQDEQTPYYNRLPLNGGRVTYPINRDTHRYPSQNDYNRWHRLPGNIATDSNRQFDKRLSYGYPNNYDNQRKPNFHHDREESIADYVKRFNYENNPHAVFYNGPSDSNFNQPVEEEIIIEDEPDDYRNIPNFPPSNNFSPDPVHKDLEQANFPESGPPLGISSFPNKHRFSPGNKAILEVHKHYNKPDYDTSNDSSDDKDIDPELIELYKKVVEAYKKKQKQKKRQGNRGFYFGKQEKNHAKPLFYLQQNKPHGNSNVKNQFHISEGERVSNVATPRHQNNMGFVFPGPVNSNNNQVTPYPPFQASPQFHKYSEPDPLYHPNGNPFQLHDTPHTSPPPLAVQSTSSFITSSTDTPQQPITEKSNNFPDSINAQLPPPEKGADTNIPYVAATVVTPKTSLETSETYATPTTEPQTALPAFVSESSTTDSLTPTNNYRNETAIAEEQLETQVKNITSGSVSETETHNQNLTSEEILSTTASSTEQPELFFLPTTGTDAISGSSSKEIPIFQEIANTSDPDRPTTYRRNYSPLVTAISNVPAVFTSVATSIQTEELDISNDNNMGNKQAHNTSTEEVKPDEVIRRGDKGDKEFDKLYSTTTEYTDKLHTNESVLFSNSPGTMQTHNSEVLPTAEATTIICENTTVTNRTSEYEQQNLLTDKFTSKNNKREEIIPESKAEENIVNNIERKGITHEKNLIHTADKRDELGYFTNSSDKGKLVSKSLTTYKPDNYHYIMSIINQARSHVILSQNDTKEQDVLF